MIFLIKVIYYISSYVFFNFSARILPDTFAPLFPRLSNEHSQPSNLEYPMNIREKKRGVKKKGWKSYTQTNRFCLRVSLNFQKQREPFKSLLGVRLLQQGPSCCVLTCPGARSQRDRGRGDITHMEEGRLSFNLEKCGVFGEV